MYIEDSLNLKVNALGVFRLKRVFKDKCMTVKLMNEETRKAMTRKLFLDSEIFIENDQIRKEREIQKEAMKIYKECKIDKDIRVGCKYSSSTTRLRKNFIRMSKGTL